MLGSKSAIGPPQDLQETIPYLQLSLHSFFSSQLKTTKFKSLNSKLDFGEKLRQSTPKGHLFKKEVNHKLPGLEELQPNAQQHYQTFSHTPSKANYEQLYLHI